MCVSNRMLEYVLLLKLIRSFPYDRIALCVGLSVPRSSHAPSWPLVVPSATIMFVAPTSSRIVLITVWCIVSHLALSGWKMSQYWSAGQFAGFCMFPGSLETLNQTYGLFLYLVASPLNQVLAPASCCPSR